MGWIYKITSPSNKIYVGQTTCDVYERFRWHKKSSSNCTLLKRALAKYKDKIVLEIIEQIHDELLDDREIYWINELNSLAPNGYNCSSGGNSNKRLSQMVKDKISDTLYQKQLDKKGYFGSVIMNKNGTFMPKVKIGGKNLYLSHSSFKTKEEAICILKEYTKNPRDFKKVDGPNKRSKKGCVYKLGSKWYLVYKHKRLGNFETEEKAREYLLSYPLQ